MKIAAFTFLLLSVSASGAEPTAAATFEATPEYIKRLEEWTPDRSTPPPPIADPAGFFGLTGKVLVSDAKKYLDGGTIIVELLDEHGTTIRIVRPAVWPGDEPKQSLIALSFPNRLRGSYLLREGGTEEEALLALMRKAIAATYGSKKPAQNTKDVFRFQAASGLTKILARHLHETEP